MAGPRMPLLAIVRQGDIKVSASVPSGNVAPCQSRCMRTGEAQGRSRSGAREGMLLPNRELETLARDSLRGTPCEGMRGQRCIATLPVHCQRSRWIDSTQVERPDSSMLLRARPR